MLSRITASILRNFPACIFFYFCLQVAIRFLVTDGVVIDESEQVMLSQFLALGYNAQPPLYTWVQKFFFLVFGEGIFALTLLKNLLMFSIYFFTYKTAYLLSKDKAVAALSAVGLLFIPQIVWEAQVDQIHTVLLTASTAALFYTYFKTAEKQSGGWYFAIGCVAACGFMAKYNFVVVLFALLLATVLVADYREKLLNKKVFIAIGTMVLLVIPHLIWLFLNKDLATGETMDRMSMDQQGSYFSDVAHGIADLVVAYLVFALPFFIFYYVLFRKQFVRKITPEVRLLIYYIAITFVSVFVIVFVIQANNIKERWLQPFLIFAPMLLFLMTDFKAIARKKVTTYITAGLVFCALVLLVIPGRVLLVDWDTKPHRENYPFADLAKEIQEEGFAEGLILTEDKFIGGNIKLFFNDSTVITPSIPLQKYEPKSKVLVVWQRNDPSAYLGHLDLSAESDVITRNIPYRYSDKFTYPVNFRFYSYDRVK